MFEKFKKKAAVVKTVSVLKDKDVEDNVKERKGSTLIRDLDTKEYDEKTILATKVTGLLGKRPTPLSRQTSESSNSSTSTSSRSKSARSSRGSSRKTSTNSKYVLKIVYFLASLTIKKLHQICRSDITPKQQEDFSEVSL